MTASLWSIEAAAAAHRLTVLGGFHPADDAADVPQGTQTLLLLGPAEPGFWAHVTGQPEWSDGGADPLDRWSRRVIGGIACANGGKALFPFTGPPWHPFQRWAQATGRIRESPVRLLVHDTAGLWVSFRGALALRQRLALPPPPPAPCDTCADQPSRSACPAGALSPAGYDVPACHAWLETPPGAACLSGGCRVRAACPISQRHGRVPEQSAYHMRRFHQ
jgi:hypothetical protein